MGLQYFIYPKASHFLFNVTKCLKRVDWIHKDCVSQPWKNCILLCQAEFAYKNSVTTATILAYDFCYTNSSFKIERHIFSCIQLQVQVRTVCGFFFYHMPIHCDIHIGQLKAAFSSHLLLWIYELYQPGCCLNICEDGITAFCSISLWPKCTWEYLR